MTTALDLVTTAMQNLGVIAIDETPSASEAAQGLNALNSMLDIWSTESLMVYTVQPEVFPLTAGKIDYTMGVGGDFNTVRPVQIEEVKIRNPQGHDYPTKMLTDNEYASLYIKTLQGSYPFYVYDDGNYPLKTLYFYPASMAGYSAVIWSWKQLTQFTGLTTVLAFPPGYKALIETNLPIWLAPKYGKGISKEIDALAQYTKGQIMRKNTSTEEMRIDPRLTDKGGARPTLAEFTKGPFT